MNPLASCPASVCAALGALGLILLIGAVWTLIELCIMRRRAALGVGALLVTLMVQVRAIVFAGHGGEYPYLIPDRLTAQLIGLPTLAFGLSLVLVAAVETALPVWVRRARKASISPDSVKEALDLLPDGVCFSRSDGRPLIVNAQMAALSHETTGSALIDERAWWARLAAGDCAAAYTVRNVPEETESPAERVPSLLLVGASGKAWQLGRGELWLDEEQVVETLAVDVTQEYALAVELERRNARLAEVNQRLRAYTRDLTRLTRDEEVLATKIHVHDELGRALVALRAYERQEQDDRDRRALLELWRQATHLLQTATVEERAADEWGLLVQAARAVDVRLVLEGELPPAGQAQDVVVALVHECLNNAVRHAGAHEVRVSLKRDGRVLAVSVRNDGRPPAAPIVETGGLADLRALVERMHGTMSVAWSPKMVVSVSFDAEES